MRQKQYEDLNELEMSKRNQIHILNSIYEQLVEQYKILKQDLFNIDVSSIPDDEFFEHLLMLEHTLTLSNVIQDIGDDLTRRDFYRLLDTAVLSKKITNSLCETFERATKIEKDNIEINSRLYEFEYLIKHLLKYTQNAIGLENLIMKFSDPN